MPGAARLSTVMTRTTGGAQSAVTARSIVRRVAVTVRPQEMLFTVFVTALVVLVALVWAYLR